ncbi:acyl-CoA dehydrogenase [Ahrensia sp. R2A130]|uniref:acyl-CoA dehydrogenase n=1 Tax=Ahrensia sp. R2A130 TaxID=744979 RepID=UPI0001E0D0A4|nr:acyl-CoA dehydrogenase [Ahrensia sp. R2A130]EFL90291.1 acyl-CoA dehydrogenase [Ahrensia sp. R2A130]
MANDTTRAANAFSRNTVLNGAANGLPDPVLEDLAELAIYTEARQAKELARLTTLFQPRLDGDAAAFDFHPAFHALARRGVTAGLAGSVWSNEEVEAGARHLTRALRLATAATLEPTHLTLLSHTHASMAALMNDSESLGRWASGLMSRQYDTGARLSAEKQGLTVALAVDAVMTAEKGEGGWTITGRGLPLPAPAADLILVRGQTTANGPPQAETCFVIDRYAAASSGLRLSISDGAAHCDFANVPAQPIGRPGDGADVMAELTTLLRLDRAVIEAGTMKAAISRAAETAHNDAQLRALADAALDVAAAHALALRLAASFDRAADDPVEAGYARLMAPVAAFWSGRLLAPVLAECGLTTEPARSPAALCDDVAQIARRGPRTVDRVVDRVAQDLGESGEGTANVLRSSREMAVADPGSIRMFMEQLAFAAAAAELQRIAPGILAEAFTETRLGRPWRSSYGMLDARHDAGDILEALGCASIHRA